MEPTNLNTDIDLNAMLAESQLQAGGLLNRCILLAGMNEALKQQLKAKDQQLKELTEQLKNQDKVVPIKT